MIKKDIGPDDKDLDIPLLRKMIDSFNALAGMSSVLFVNPMFEKLDTGLFRINQGLTKLVGISEYAAKLMAKAAIRSTDLLSDVLIWVGKFSASLVAGAIVAPYGLYRVVGSVVNAGTRIWETSIGYATDLYSRQNFARKVGTTSGAVTAFNKNAAPYLRDPEQVLSNASIAMSDEKSPQANAFRNIGINPAQYRDSTKLAAEFVVKARKQLIEWGATGVLQYQFEYAHLDSVITLQDLLNLYNVPDNFKEQVEKDTFAYNIPSADTVKISDWVISARETAAKGKVAVAHFVVDGIPLLTQLSTWMTDLVTELFGNEELHKLLRSSIRAFITWLNSITSKDVADAFIGFGNVVRTFANTFGIYETSIHIINLATRGGIYARVRGSHSYRGYSTTQGGPSDTSTVTTSISSEARGLLDTIAAGEAKSYLTVNGGQQLTSYPDAPVGRATGRYQFIGSTWTAVARKYHIVGGMTPENQDMAAWYLAQETYKQRTGRDLDVDLKRHDIQTDQQILTALSGVWPSLPGGSQQDQSMPLALSRLLANEKKYEGKPPTPTTNVPTSSTSVTPPQKISPSNSRVFGDSLAVGIKLATGIPGDPVVGENPSVVLDQINAYNGSLENTRVILSTGMSNDPKQIAMYLPKQIAALRAKGAKDSNIYIMGGGSRPDIAEGSKTIREMLNEAYPDIHFQPIDVDTPGGVHPTMQGYKTLADEMMKVSASEAPQVKPPATTTLDYSSGTSMFPETQEGVAAAKQYLSSLSRNATRLGDTSALHPIYALRLARAIKAARDEGMNISIQSAFRPPSAAQSGWDFQGYSQHNWGAAADLGGIGADNSPQWKEFVRIATKEGLYNPYIGTPSKSREYNHWQLLPYELTPNSTVYKELEASDKTPEHVWNILLPYKLKDDPTQAPSPLPVHKDESKRPNSEMPSVIDAYSRGHVEFVYEHGGIGHM